MNQPNRASKRKKNRKQQIVAALVKVGPVKLLALSSLLGIALIAGAYYTYISNGNTQNQALQTELMQKRKTNAIATMVQQTKPDFLKEFRRVIDNYTTARELLPSETEVSNVLDAIQQMARQNGVRVTMFDASKPGAKSTNPAAQTAAATQTANADPSLPPQPQTTLNERVMPAQIQGSHTAIARFLSDIAKYPRIIYVRDFSITSMSRAQESVNLTLVTYDAPTSGILPPIPAELQKEYQAQGNKPANLVKQ